ncbi:hypothetical protein EUTSA_v10005330mg [Eutrema salsugineum]|uniref:Oleosin n=1 Tax=Eutrema salsugineum TaxID=72664 RepID=V4KWN2_EUTSA|nr:oleosin-B1 [Eutrema salsugineum]ESQ31773.1 hypothetical protein EUTSA_v10005330mg [Eutrema salsugineum]
MRFVGTKDKPAVYGSIAAVSLMILTGLTLAGTGVVLIVMTPVFVFLSPILVPAVITSSFLATGFLASGSLGASAIALLVWLYKKEEEHFRYNLHARVRPKGDIGGNLSGGDRPPEKDTVAGEIKPAEREKPVEEEKPSEKEKLSERDNPAEEDKSPGVVNHAEEEPTIIPEISKVLLAEQNTVGPQRYGSSTSTQRSHHQIRLAMDPTKVRSLFMKECQKVPRVGASAYKYFTSRDKKYFYSHS